MKLTIKTLVKGNYKAVYQRFNQELFEKLSPPGAKVDLVQFDGSSKGDIVHIRLKLFGILTEDWVSEIIDSNVTDEQAFFIDQGTELPSFLAYWKHRHLINKISEDTSEIVDAIEFRTPFFLLDWLMYPVLYLQFLYRKPIYKQFFGK